MKEHAFVLEKIHESINQYPGNDAFCIQEKFYTYNHLGRLITSYLQQLEEKGVYAVSAHEDIETYASILAIWFSGNTALPISPRNPASRNAAIINQVPLVKAFDSQIEKQKVPYPPSIHVINTKNILPSHQVGIPVPAIAPDDTQYILFTSGSTGQPKGVRISYKNLSNFINSFITIGFELEASDRALQIYDLGFDASIHCYVLGLCSGACVYTVPQTGIKYLDAYKVLSNHDITFAKMPPSTVHFLKPYFTKIKLPHLKHCLFGGEALSEKLAMEWRPCVPNANLYNVYGPTEVTINCTLYRIPREKKLKTHQGTVSIGKPFGGSHALIVDGQNKKLPVGNTGELCFTGNQVSNGYWKNPGQDKKAFITGPKGKRYYKTGDMAFMDDDKDIFFMGRVDDQFQVQGFRVEMGEIEKHVRDFTGKTLVVAMGWRLEDSSQIIVFIEKFSGNQENLKKYLEEKLPKYMLPGKILNVENFPLNVSGKVNRKKILDDYIKHHHD